MVQTRRCSRFVEGALLAALLAAPGSRSACANPPAQAAPLSAEAREFFAWWDTLGFPDVTQLPFIKLWTPYRNHGIAEDAEFEGAFLVAEEGAKFTVFCTDLQILHLTVQPGKQDDGGEGAIRFVRADIAQFVRESLERIEKVGPEVVWWDKPDPFGAHRWAIPNQAFRIAVLARACAGHGLDDLANRLLDRAQHEKTRPSNSEQYGDDDPRPRAKLDGFRLDIQGEAYAVVEEMYADASLTWADLLAEEERLARAFRPSSLTDPDGRIAELRRNVAEGQRAREHPSKPLAELSQDEAIERLIHDLRDVGTFSWEPGRSAHDKPPPDAEDHLEALGLAAVPALIDALDDDRITRGLEQHWTGKGQFRDSVSHIYVGDVAWRILDKLSGGTLGHTKHGGPPTSGEPTKRQVAERWYATVKGGGEMALLVDAVKRGDRGSREAAERLVRLDLARAVEAIEAGIRAASEEHVATNLVQELAKLEGPAGLEALLRLLPALRGTEPGVKAAWVLCQRGRKEGLAALVQAWKHAAQPARRALGAWNEKHELIRALVASNSLEAVQALTERLSERPVDDRIEVLTEFWPSAQGFARDWLGAGPPASPGLESAIEALLASQLEDTTRREGLRMGDKPAGQEPIVGEIAAWVLADRLPERYAFDPMGTTREREAQRIAAANRWRAAQGLPPIAPPQRRAGPPALSFDVLKDDLQAAATSNEESVRTKALAALESHGLPAVPALREALGRLDAAAPGLKQVQALLGRLALVIAQVRLDGPETLAGDAFRQALDAAKGKPVTGAMWWDLYAQFAKSAPEGATTHLALRMERESAEAGVLVIVTLSPTKPGIGTQDVGDVSFEHPSVRAGDVVTHGGGGAMPVSVFSRPGGFLEYEGELDGHLAAAALDDTVRIVGEVTVHR